jgi:hypothetical protein
VNVPNDVIYVLAHRHRVFDGTNIPDLLDAIRTYYPAAYVSASANYPGASATCTVMSDTEVNNGPVPYHFSVGDSWLPSQGGQFSAAVLEDTSYAVPLVNFIRDNAPAPALAVGYEITPNLEAGASATVVVPMVPALPDAGYNVVVSLAGSGQLLGSLQIMGHTVVSASAVNVDILNTNGVLELGGATVLVTALHNG